MAELMELWSEGYAATGEHGRAQFLGKFFANTFNEAVQEWNRTKNDNNQYGKLECRNGVWEVWGCRIFDNEEDARKAFG